MCIGQCRAVTEIGQWQREVRRERAVVVNAQSSQCAGIGVGELEDLRK